MIGPYLYIHVLQYYSIFGSLCASRRQKSAAKNGCNAGYLFRDDDATSFDFDNFALTTIMLDDFSKFSSALGAHQICKNMEKSLVQLDLNQSLLKPISPQTGLQINFQNQMREKLPKSNSV